MADNAADNSDSPKLLMVAAPFEVRGTSAYTLRLASQLTEDGVSLRIVTPDSSRIDPEKRKSLTIVSCPQLDIPLWRRVVRHFLYNDLASEVPDLIHVQSRAALATGNWLANQFERPYVLTVHDFLASRERIRIDLAWCRQVICVSESVRDDLQARAHLPAELLTVIRSGVEGTDKTPDARILDPDHIPVIGAASPLEAVKGLQFFLGAAQRVLATGRKVEFLIAGAGPEEGNLRRLARDLEITEHITFVPNLLDFKRSIEAMDIFCLPSIRQGLGTVMLEAMALGKPVIATRVDGPNQIVVPSETGMVVPPSNSARMAEAMLQLLDDPERAIALGQAARQFVSREFSVERMVRETRDCYRMAVAEHVR